MYPPTSVKHVSKIWPRNSFQPPYIIIFCVNIGSILTISQFGMYVKQVPTTAIFEIIKLKLIRTQIICPQCHFLPSLHHMSLHSQSRCYILLPQCISYCVYTKSETETCAYWRMSSYWYAHPSKSPPLPSTPFSDLGTTHKAFIFILEWADHGIQIKGIFMNILYFSFLCVICITVGFCSHATVKLCFVHRDLNSSGSWFCPQIVHTSLQALKDTRHILCLHNK